MKPHLLPEVRRVCAILAAISCLGAVPGGAVPLEVPYVGHLEFESGIAYEGFVTLQLTLYATANPIAGVDMPVWGPATYNDLYVRSGVLAAVIGGGESPPLDSAILQSGLLWLQIRLNGQILDPPQRVLSVPYAIVAGDAARLGGLEPDSYLTAPDLHDLGYVTGDNLTASFASKATETDVAALQQNIQSLTSAVEALQAQMSALQSCCEGTPQGPCAGLQEGASCDDGNACTSSDSCANGLCSGVPINCDTGAPCTLFSCEPATGCQSTPDPSPACAAQPSAEVVLEGRSHFNAARLDNEHIVVAWGIETNLSAAHTGFYVQVWRRAKPNWIKGPALWVSQPLLPVNSTNALAMMGAIGSEHAILVVEFQDTSGWGRRLMAFRRTELSLSQVGSYPQENRAFFMGHPIDANRYLLRYRYNNSGQPVYYRVVSRSGDQLTFGTELQRPVPASFPSGAAASEPQTYDPLVRISATQFREIRGGYVWTTSKQSSWILTVAANNTLSSSGLITHSSSAEKAMSAVAVGNGSGGVAMVYESYQAGLHAATMSGTTFAPLGQILTQGGPTIQAPGLDSTDGFYANKYWIRHMQSGRLLRFDALGSIPNEVLVNLPGTACYTAPHLLRLGNEFIALTCPTAGPLAVQTIQPDALL